MTRSTVRTAK